MRVATWVLALVGVLLTAMPMALVWALRAYLRAERARKAEAAARVEAEAVADELRDGWAAADASRRAAEVADRERAEEIDAERDEAAAGVEAMADRSLAEFAAWWNVVRGRGR